MSPVTSHYGFVLTELLVAGLVSAFLVLGLVQMAAASSRGLQLIESISQTQQGGRFAVQQMQRAVMAAGFNPQPWTHSVPEPGLLAATEDGGSGESDKLAVHQVSDRNCFENLNPVQDASGQAAFYVRESTFERSGTGNLAHTCFYGPEGGTLIRQINRQGIAEGVESFQLLFAEDTNGDRLADRRVRAGHWSDPNNVLGIDVAMLVASNDAGGDRAAQTFTILDQSMSSPADGRIRRVWSFSIPLGSRLR